MKRMAYSEKQKEYTMKYLDKLKEVRFRVKPEDYARYKAAADQEGLSVRAFIMMAIDEKIDHIAH